MDQTVLKDKITTEFKSGIGNPIQTNAKLNTVLITYGFNISPPLAITLSAKVAQKLDTMNMGDTLL